MITELRRALVALGYFTRTPIPARVGWSAQDLDHAARYFPLAGAVVGAVGAAALLGAALLWPLPVALALSMLGTLLFTGGLHEDGLADSADGFGGGYTRERRLEIMRDPRVGSFGVLALVMVLLIKFVALLELAQPAVAQAALALLVAHAASRAAALVLMARLPYAREDDASGASRARPVTQGSGPRDAAVGLCLGLSPALLATAAGAMAPLALLALLAAVTLVVLGATRYLRARIGGYTGDSLGATQQIAEIAIYLALLATRA